MNNINNSYKFLLTSLFLGVLFSCEDQIDVQLDESETFTVVDAFLNNNAEDQTMRLSKSLTYFENIIPEGIVGAQVSISSSSGMSFDFEDMGDGFYTWKSNNNNDNLGVVGDQLTLNITEGTETYNSKVTINGSPAIDSIGYEDRDDLFFDGIYAEFFARDLPGLGDTYWIKSFKNGVFLNKPEEINIAYDASFDSGAEVDNFIFIPPIRELINPVMDSIGISPWDVGDVVRVEIHSLNLEVFSFLETARDQILNGLNGIFAEPLANTEGNIKSVSGNKTILGAFCVSEITSREIVIQ